MIREIEIRGSEVFPSGSFKVELGLRDVGGPTVHYLVGNNGSGKSTILKVLFETLRGFGGGPLGCSLYLTTTSGTFEFPNPDPMAMAEQSRALDVFGLVLYSPTFSATERMLTGRFSDVLDDSGPTNVVDNPEQDIRRCLISVLNQDVARKNAYNAAFVEACERGEPPLPPFQPTFDRFKVAIEPFLPGFSVDLSGNVSVSGVPRPYDSLSDGEKFIIYRMAQIAKDMNRLDSALLLIDEPEAHLHPQWQSAFKKSLLRMLEGQRVQILIATHSPFIFQENDPEREECLFIDRWIPAASPVELTVTDLNDARVTSVNLVSYVALGIVSPQLHIELYELVLKKFEIGDSAGDVRTADDRIHALTSTRQNRHVRGEATFTGGRSAEETTPTWIRNSLHHPGNGERKTFDHADLKISIDEMIRILNTSEPPDAS